MRSDQNAFKIYANFEYMHKLVDKENCFDEQMLSIKR